MRSPLSRTANLCMKGALEDNCFIVTHPARTLWDLKTTLSRSRNSARSKFFSLFRLAEASQFQWKYTHLQKQRNWHPLCFFFWRWCLGRVETQKSWLRITGILAYFNLLGAAVFKCTAVMNNEVHQGCFSKATPKAFLLWQRYLIFWEGKQYINRAQSSAAWTPLTEGAGWFMSAMVLDLTLPFFSLGYLNKTAVCLCHQYSKVLLGHGTKKAEKTRPPLCRWDKVLWLKHDMMPCYNSSWLWGDIPRVLPLSVKRSWNC